MASVQARHARGCATAKPWTPAASLDGCDCGPTFYVVVREGRKVHRERVGKNRRDADRALRKIGSDVDDGAYQPQPNVRFEAWADTWHSSLRRPRASTCDSYVSTLGYAKRAFGDRVVRRLAPADVDRMLALMEEAGCSPSTQAKHLRVLGACLGAAVRRGYAARNPVRLLDPAEKPRAEKREAAYFVSEELPRLLAEVPEGVFRTLVRVALMTGMRQGELVALTWGDVDLADAVIRVRRHYRAGRLGEPKNHERRDVDLTTGVVELLGAWWGECGHPADDVLVLPSERGGYLVDSTIRRVLYDDAWRASTRADREPPGAMGRAGIARLGPTGEERTFHSLRHTYAKLALENGTAITWLQRQLGHSSIKVTCDLYGHFERAARKLEAAKLENVFGPNLGVVAGA